MKNSSVFLLCLTFLISVFMVTKTYKNRSRAHDMINVTGLGKQDFTSDLIVWSGSFTKKDTALEVAFNELKKDQEKVKDYLVSKGLKETEIVFSSVDINKEFDYTYDENGLRNSTFTGYRLTQRIEIESKEVDLIEKISREVTELINKGVEFYSNPPEYYYTQLAQLKIDMIAAATEDARTRAEKIAENAGGKLGRLEYANMGVFQIIAQNSSEDYSWGGSFNTSSKNKTATITMKLQFGIEE